MKLKNSQVPEVFYDPDGRGVVAWLPHFNPERVVETWLVSFEQPITGLRRISRIAPGSSAAGQTAGLGASTRAISRPDWITKALRLARGFGSARSTWA
jgi:hypothetical protein